MQRRTLNRLQSSGLSLLVERTARTSQPMLAEMMFGEKILTKEVEENEENQIINANGMAEQVESLELSLQVANAMKKVGKLTYRACSFQLVGFQEAARRCKPTHDVSWSTTVNLVLSNPPYNVRNDVADVNPHYEASSLIVGDV